MYSNLKDSSSFTTIQTPETFLPNPSEQDYIDKKINRYFIQKSNDKKSPVFEISEDLFNELNQNPYWTKVQLEWKIQGELEPVFNEKGKLIDMGVKNFNLNEISKFQKAIPTLKSYLINSLQFYKPYRV